MEYSNFNIGRKQAQQLAFAIIADIEEYVDQHRSEFETFLASEEKGGDKQEKK